MKTTYRMGENFSKDITSNILIFKINSSYNSILKKNLLRERAEEQNRHFSKEKMQIANRSMKKMFNITNQRNANQNHNEI